MGCVPDAWVVVPVRDGGSDATLTDTGLIDPFVDETGVCEGDGESACGCRSGQPRCSGSACPRCTQVVFAENWESGTGAWRAFDTRPITVASASPPCAGTYLHETAIFPQGGGRLFTIAPTPVVGGRTYCLSSWVRGTPGAGPYVGFIRSNSVGQGSYYEQFWGLGGCGDFDYLGGTVTPMVSDNTWRWYAKQMIMPTGWTHVLLRLQLFTGPAGSAADFDQVQLVEGPCPAAPPTTCAAVACSGTP